MVALNIENESEDVVKGTRFESAGRVIDHGGEVLESFVHKTCDKACATTLMRKA